METKNVWCIKTHIVNNCKTITDDVRLFKYLEDAEKAFNNIVEEQREIAISKEFVIEYDDKRNFEAHEKDYYEHNHICVSLIYLEHLRKYPFQIKIE